MTVFSIFTTNENNYRLTLWAAHLFAEQQTVTLLMVIKNSYTAAITSIYITIIYLVLGSATVRYVKHLNDRVTYQLKLNDVTS